MAGLSDERERAWGGEPKPNLDHPPTFVQHLFLVDHHSWCINKTLTKPAHTPPGFSDGWLTIVPGRRTCQWNAKGTCCMEVCIYVWFVDLHDVT